MTHGRTSQHPPRPARRRQAHDGHALPLPRPRHPGVHRRHRAVRLRGVRRRVCHLRHAAALSPRPRGAVRKPAADDQAGSGQRDLLGADGARRRVQGRPLHRHPHAGGRGARAPGRAARHALAGRPDGRQAAPSRPRRLRVAGLRGGPGLGRDGDHDREEGGRGEHRRHPDRRPRARHRHDAVGPHRLPLLIRPGGGDGRGRRSRGRGAGDPQVAGVRRRPADRDRGGRAGAALHRPRRAALLHRLGSRPHAGPLPRPRRGPAAACSTVSDPAALARGSLSPAASSRGASCPRTTASTTSACPVPPPR